MQGLFTEARSQYLQVAEIYLKSKKTAEAMKILQKLLDLEPDNLQIQQRLAELYEEHGRKEEAANIYRRVAERLLQREESGEAQKWMAKASRLAPESLDVLLTRAKLLAEGLSEISDLEVPPQYTNIVRFQLSKDAKIKPDDLLAKLNAQGIRIGRGGPWGFRAVTHYWIDDQALEKTLRAFHKIFTD